VIGAWYELLLGACGGIWREGGEGGSGDATASWGESAWMISRVPSLLMGMPVSVVTLTGKDGVLGDGERGVYLSEGEQERASLQVGEAGI